VTTRRGLTTSDADGRPALEPTVAKDDTVLQNADFTNVDPDRHPRFPHAGRVRKAEAYCGPFCDTSPEGDAMASADQLKALLRSFVDRDDAQFLSIAMQVAAYEARRGHTKLADELRQMIDAAKSRQVGRELVGRDPTPIAKPRGELSGLVSVSYPRQRLSSLVTTDAIRERLLRCCKSQRLLRRAFNTSRPVASTGKRSASNRRASATQISLAWPTRR
jgi:hypothetical protein